MGAEQASYETVTEIRAAAGAGAGRQATLSDASTRPHRDRALDGLRGFAVILTFLVHFASMFAERRLGWSVDSSLYAQGDLLSLLVGWLYVSMHGVYLFFLLSGMFIWRKLIDIEPPMRRFLAERALRIVPAAWASLVVTALVANSVLGQPPPSATEWILNASFLYGQHEFPVQPINFVTWSLFYEWCFYLLAPLVAWLSMRPGNGRHLAVACCLVLALVVARLHPLYLAYLALFVIGACIREPGPERLPSWKGDLMLVAIFAAWTALPGALIALPTSGPADALATVWLYALHVIGFGLVGAALIRRLLAPAGFLYRVFSAPALLAVGKVSYSLFLFHPAALLWYFNTAYGSGRTDAGFAQLALDVLITFGLSFLLARLMFTLFETPYFRYRRGVRASR